MGERGAGVVARAVVEYGGWLEVERLAVDAGVDWEGLAGYCRVGVAEPAGRLLADRFVAAVAGEVAARAVGQHACREEEEEEEEEGQRVRRESGESQERVRRVRRA